MSATAYFVGPTDNATCDEPDGGCDGAVNGNPYTIDTVPQPGDFACMGNCRHMIQLADDAPPGTAQYTWRGSLGFQEEPDDAIAPQESETRSFVDDLNLNQSASDIAADMKTRNLSFDEVAPYLDDATQVELAQQFIQGQMPQEYVDKWLDSGDVDLLSGVMVDEPDALDYAKTLAVQGFDNHSSQEAYDLADALTQATDTTYTVKLNPLDMRWYVVPSA